MKKKSGLLGNVSCGDGSDGVEDDVAHLVGDKGLLLDEGEEGVDGIVPDLGGTGSLRRLAELQRDLNYQGKRKMPNFYFLLPTITVHCKKKFFLNLF